MAKWGLNFFSYSTVVDNFLDKWNVCRLGNLTKSRVFRLGTYLFKCVAIINGVVVDMQ